MPLFFFDVAEGEQVYPDAVGIELPDVSDARSHAVEIIATYVRQAEWSGAHRCRVDVTDQCRAALLCLTIELTPLSCEAYTPPKFDEQGDQ
jgi:hypothetical protein